jgi:hypothetical protein
MKKTSIKNFVCAIKIALCLCFSVGFYADSKAQTLVLPSHPDNFWFSMGLPWSLNTAEIAYGSNTLFASVVASGMGGIGTTVINVNDFLSGSTTSIAGATLTITGADIIIGNSDGTGGRSSSNDYILATSFVNYSGDPQIDFYDVNISPLISITPISSFVISPGTYTPVKVHIDIIADYGNTAITGLPFCGKFMVTWDDGVALGTPNVYVAEGDLNTQTVTLPATLVGPGSAPDVAGIERGTLSAHSDYAIIAYQGIGNNSLLCSRWLAGSPTVMGPVTLDAGGTSSVIIAPRIDAFDDFNINSNPSISQFKVVAQVLNTSATPNYEVRTYDNFLAYLGYPVSSVENYTSIVPGYPGPQYNNFYPSVAVWGRQDYAILHVVQPLPLMWTYQDLLTVDPIDISNPHTFWGNHYFKVNSVSAGLYDATHADFFNSVSSCPNMLSYNYPEIFTWALYNGSYYEIHYKDCLGPPSFRPGSTPAGVENVQSEEVEIYPNPATDHIFVKNTQGFAALDYRIMDITGHVVLQGNLTGPTWNIDISKLVKGFYIINTYGGDSENKNMQFVKN